MRPLAQGAAILIAGTALGLALNAASPRPARLAEAVYPAAASGTSVCGATGRAAAPVLRQMPLQEALRACSDCRVAFVDARGAAAFAEGHIPGAFHLPPEGCSEERAILEKLGHFETIVVYGAVDGCSLSEGVAERLSSLGFKDVRLLDGCWTEWAEANGPAASGACRGCEGDHAPHGAEASTGGAP